MAAYFVVEGAVKAILHERVATDAKNEYGQPLLREARNGHEAVVKQLLEKGADLETPTFRPWSDVRSSIENYVN